MAGIHYVTLMDRPELKSDAASWFHSKWGVPEEAYLTCMEAYLSKKQNMAGICACVTVISSVGWGSLKMISMTVPILHPMSAPSTRSRLTANKESPGNC